MVSGIAFWICHTSFYLHCFVACCWIYLYSGLQHDMLPGVAIMVNKPPPGQPYISLGISEKLTHCALCAILFWRALEFILFSHMPLWKWIILSSVSLSSTLSLIYTLLPYLCSLYLMAFYNHFSRYIQFVVLVLLKLPCTLIYVNSRK